MNDRKQKGRSAPPLLEPELQFGEDEFEMLSETEIEEAKAVLYYLPPIPEKPEKKKKNKEPVQLSAAKAVE